jgi:hypothetical protein
MTPRHPRLRRWAWISAGLLVGFTAISGAMHLPVVQRAMGWVDDNGQVACPFGHGAAGPRAPRELDMSLSAAASRPALGFVARRDHPRRPRRLGQRPRRHLHACPSQPRVVTCTAVPAAALASGLDATAAWFEFGDHGTLASIKTTRHAATSTPVADEYRATEALVSQSAGAPAVARNEALATLDRGAFHQAVVEYKFRDYRATIRATNMGDSFLLTEQYASNLQ